GYLTKEAAMRLKTRYFFVALVLAILAGSEPAHAIKPLCDSEDVTVEVVAYAYYFDHVWNCPEEGGVPDEGCRQRVSQQSWAFAYAYCGSTWNQFQNF